MMMMRTVMAMMKAMVTVTLDSDTVMVTVMLLISTVMVGIPS